MSRAASRSSSSSRRKSAVSAPSSRHTPVPDRKYMISQLSSWMCRPMEEPG